MKSISNSDHIYFGIACRKSIPRFLLISVKYLCLSTFPKVADLIGGQSLIASHFLWQVCQTGKCMSGTLRSTRWPTPFALFFYSGRLEAVNAPNQSPAPGSIDRNRTTFMVGVTEAVSLLSPRSGAVSGAVGNLSVLSGAHWPSSNENSFARHQRLLGPQVFFSSPFLSDFSADRCMLLAEAGSSWQEDSNLSSQK